MQSFRHSGLAAAPNLRTFQDKTPRRWRPRRYARRGDKRMFVGQHRQPDRKLILSGPSYALHRPLRGGCDVCPVLSGPRLRAEDEDGWASGYVVGLGPEFFAIELIDKAIGFDGYNCLR
jgi:hypothetical protein